MKTLNTPISKYNVRVVTKPFAEGDPIIVVKRLRDRHYFRYIRRSRAKAIARCFRRGLRKFGSFNYYQCQVTGGGKVQIGCSRFTKKQINEMARQLGWKPVFATA